MLSGVKGKLFYRSYDSENTVAHADGKETRRQELDYPVMTSTPLANGAILHYAFLIFFTSAKLCLNRNESGLLACSPAPREARGVT